jgi:hypothetical protein
MSLLATLKSGKQIRKTVTFPGTDVQFEFRLLSEQDKFDAALQTDMLYKDNPVGFHNHNDYLNEKTTQQLFRACVIAGVDLPIAASITEFRKLITGNERDILIDQYNEFDRENNPSPNTLTKDEFDKLMFDLKKKPEQTIGSILNLQTARKVITSLVSQPVILPKDNGSISTQ